MSRYFAPAKGVPEDPVDRRCALHACAVLGGATEQDRVSGISGFTAWRRGCVSRGWGSGRVGGYMRFLP